MSKAKPYSISKHLVVKAYRLVKANRGAAGVDGQSLKAFEENQKDNLYKIWNRMSSGSYCPVGPENSIGQLPTDLHGSDSSRLGPHEILLAIRYSEQPPSRFVNPVNGRSTSGYQHHGLACHPVQHAPWGISVTSIPTDRELGPPAPAGDLSTNLSPPAHTSP